MKSKKSNLSPQENKKICFVSNRYHLVEESISCPKPIGRTLPSWYKEASVHIMDKMTNQPWVNPADGEKIPNWTDY